MDFTCEQCPGWTESACNREPLNRHAKVNDGLIDHLMVTGGNLPVRGQNAVQSVTTFQYRSLILYTGIPKLQQLQRTTCATEILPFRLCVRKRQRDE